MHRPRGPNRPQEREPVRQGGPEATPTVLDHSLVGVQERRKGGAGEEVGKRGPDSNCTQVQCPCIQVQVETKGTGRNEVAHI